MVKKLWGNIGGRELTTSVERTISEISTEVQAHMALAIRTESLLMELLSEIDTVKNAVKDVCATVEELKGTNHIGKKPVILTEVSEEVKKMTHKQIRNAIHGAAKRQPTGYNAIYLKVKELTGIDVFAIGKTKITPADGLGFVNNNETYINALFKENVSQEAGAIALDIIRNK